ncbi:MAG: hypothetical protein CL946_06010 [Ectothiorhodospiraceae bacterium]|nr:hypothetical protein [Ectothiorhodospiraceae bacterium]
MRERSVTLLVCVFFSIPIAGAQTLEWMNPTPRGTTVTDLIFFDAAHMLLSCADGTMLESTDAGSRWRERTFSGDDAILSMYKMETGVLVAATRAGYLLRSLDGGKSWTAVHEPEPDGSQYGEDNRIVMYDDDNGFAILGSNILILTQNGGISWNRLITTAISEYYPILGFAPQDARRWWMFHNGVVMRTTNTGSSWHEVQSQMQSSLVYSFKFLDGFHGLCGAYDGIYRSSDGGDSWQRAESEGDEPIGGFAFKPGLDGAVYGIGYDQSVVQRSMSGGAHWERIMEPDAFDSQPGAYKIVMYDQQTGAVIGPGGRVYRTDNGGNTWELLHGAGVVRDIIQLQPGLPLTAYTPDFSFTFDPATMQITRTEFPLGFSPDLLSLHKSRAGYMLKQHSPYTYGVYYTSDGGATLEYRSELPVYSHSNIPAMLHTMSVESLVVGYKYGTAYRSSDGGRSFDSLAIDPFAQWWIGSAHEAQRFDDQTHVFTSDMGFSLTEDGGESWHFIRKPHVQTGYEDASFIAPGEGYCLIEGRLYRVWNFFLEWEWTHHSGLFEKIHFFDMQHGAAITSEGGLVMSRDSGSTWRETGITAPEDCGWLWPSHKECWFYGKEGRLQRASGFLPLSAHGARTVRGFTLETPYPNPARAHSKVTFTITAERPSPQNVRLVVQDALGREIQQLTDGEIHGTQRVHYTPKSPGLYHIRMHTASGILTQKLVVR